MTVSEIKAELQALDEREIAHLAAFAMHLARRKDPAFLSRLDQEWEGIEKGGSMMLGDLKRLDDDLSKSGL